MNEFILKYAVHIIIGLIALFGSAAGWVVKEYYANQKKTDESQTKNINGLGERLNVAMGKLEKEMRDFRLEMKQDIKEVSGKVDMALGDLHDIEKRLMIKGFEEELKRVKASGMKNT